MKHIAAVNTGDADVKKFPVPDRWGTNYTRVVIVVTQMTDTTLNSFKVEYEVKAKVE